MQISDWRKELDAILLQFNILKSEFISNHLIKG